MLSLKGFWRFGLDSHQVEFLWTIIPFLVIIVFAVPSLVSLYLLAASPISRSAPSSTPKLVEHRIKQVKRLFNFNSMFNAEIELTGRHIRKLARNSRKNILVTGRQWYWDYSLVIKNPSNNFYLSTSSHIINTADVFHLLQLDQWLFLSTGTNYNFAVTSGDVLHSFAIPTLAIKIDAVPGKDNTICCAPVIPGLYFGNCSEICGVNHSVIPIGIVVDYDAPSKVDLTQFLGAFEKATSFLKACLLIALSCAVKVRLLI